MIIFHRNDFSLYFRIRKITLIRGLQTTSVPPLYRKHSDVLLIHLLDLKSDSQQVKVSLLRIKLN